jgi:apolipoprotein N-acyltransferase
MEKILENRLILLLISILPAVPWAFSHAPHVFMVVHWVALFAMLHGLKAASAARWWCGAAAAFYAVGLWWLPKIFSIAAVPLCFILGAFYYLMGGLLVWSTQHRLMAGRPWAKAVLAALVVAAIEYYRCEWFPLRFPWFTGGMAVGPALLSPWIGVYGVSFVLILAASLVVFGTGKIRFAWGAALLGIASLPVWDSGVDGKKIPVLAVQNEAVPLSSYLKATEQIPLQDGFLVWPEYATTEDVRQSKPGLTELQKLAEKRNSVLVLGGFRAGPKPNSKWNEALAIDRTGILGTHEKNRPVHLMADGWPSSRAESVQTPHGRIGMPICFDNDYTEVVRRITAHGAEVFIVPSFDASNWSETQHWQHSRLFQCRAAETGRWFCVAAASGITQIISPEGKRVAVAKPLAATTLLGEVARRTGQTPFVQLGWLFPWAVCGVAVVWLTLLLASKMCRRVVN